MGPADTPEIRAKVRDAIIKANGRAQMAHKLLWERCTQDHELLLALVTPFMKGILSHAFQKEAGGAGGGKPAAAKARPAGGGGRRRGLTDTAMDSLVGQMSRNIGKTKTPPRGMTALVSPKDKPAKTSQRHEETLRALSKIYMARRLDKDRDD